MRIREKFYELKAKNEGALIAYVCAGDPVPQKTKYHVEALAMGGADIIELGLPFSDPVADGPAIQAGNKRALNAGMTPDVYFEVACSLNVDIPLIAMTYYNLIFRRGDEKFIKDCVSSGISGIIVPDLPLEEAQEFAFTCKKYDIDLIFLLGQTTGDDMIERIAALGGGFIYLVTRPGVTGIRTDIASLTSCLTRDLIERVKSKTELPVAVGFGISNSLQAAEIISSGANGVIVGSAFVDIISRGGDVSWNLETLARELKKGIRAGQVSLREKSYQIPLIP